ncbi:hypothetical protein SADUNF_Sadunf17G0129900 [Salix dunnii]|uniref:Malectin-like domain-containing protein n=1 Tax=Salix dunnii TaxID=1413687 RepID=A0A835J689_9ROSI|nr:hypothetical protein SADUNF_Sadunf17G0129900 [Salix dunnii]
METNTLLLLSLALLSLICFSTSFSPIDNFLVNCGSNTNTSFTPTDSRVFLPDSTEQGPVLLTKGQSISLKNQNPSPNSPTLYNTARVFTTASSYKFNIMRNGTHLVRFHFSPFKAQGFDLSTAKFSVFVNGNLLLNDFSTKVVVLKEYILRVDDNTLEISFSPVGESGFGFVNAIEVFSAPKDFILDEGAKLVGANEIEVYKNLSSHVLETIHRINVGGSKLVPFNDTLWRTWTPDEDFLVLKSAAKLAVTTHVPNYQSGGASREIAPENVYMTAQQMNKDNNPLQPRFNITWNFPVGSGGVRHLVRLHFCDIVSTSLNQLYFDVYLNEYSAYNDLDLSSLTFHILSSPMYMDFIVDSNDLGAVQVSVGPSAVSSLNKVNAILNGVEIMKMVNPSHSQSGSKKRTVWIVVASGIGVLVLCLVVFVAILACKYKKRKPKPRRVESAGWTPLRVYGGSTHSRMSEVTVNEYRSLKIPFADVQPAVDPLLAREQVNLAEWAMQWQKKGILEQIIDPHLMGQIKKNSLKKFGETAEKCLADYGVDRPSMGDVLWNLEYALQLQESDSKASREPHDDSNANVPELRTPRIAPRTPSINTETETDSGDGPSEIRNSQVFSQLMTNDGR